jgi:L-rhamnose mutarotase
MTKFNFSVSEHMIRMSREGYSDKHAELIEKILEELKQADFSDYAIKEFLIDAFQQIQNGKDANKAFLQVGEVSGRNKKKFSDLEKELEVSRYILNFIMLPKSDRPTYEQCYNMAADKFGIGTETAKKHYLSHKDYLLEMLTETGYQKK